MFGWLKTMILFSGIIALFGAIGALVGGKSGMLFALLFAGVMNFFAYWFSDKMVLKMYGAKQVDRLSSPYLYNIVFDLANKAELPMPKVFIIDEAQPNAFATGRNPEHAAVAATTGILNLLSERELRGVMAHELAHIKHRDILISTVAATVSGAISAIANFAMFFDHKYEDGNSHNLVTQIAVSLLAPIAASLIQMSISRSREFEADRGGAEISGDPLALADALLKIESFAKGIPMETAEHHPATAQMMIINPLFGGKIDNLFSTHPRTADRVNKLREMASAI